MSTEIIKDRNASLSIQLKETESCIQKSYNNIKEYVCISNRSATDNKESTYAYEEVNGTNYCDCEFKERCEVLEKDLIKARAEAIRLNHEVDKLRKMLSIEGPSQNNTSASSYLPSEFKEEWKELVTVKLVDALANYYDRQYVLVLLTQSIFKISIEKAKESLQSKLDEVKTVLIKNWKCLPENEELRAMQTKLAKVIFQEFMKLIFKSDQKFVESVKESLKLEIVSSFSHLLTSEDFESLVIDNSDEDIQFHEDFDDMLESDEFNTFIETLYDLCIYMVLTDPPILLNTINTKEFVQKKLENTDISFKECNPFKYLKFDKSKCECVDGFPQENKVCMVVVEAPK